MSLSVKVDDFSIISSVRDGHCLLHSVVSSWNEQLSDELQPPTLSYRSLVDKLQRHMRSYGKFYAEKGQLDQQQFYLQVCDYITHKNFDLEAVDLIPYVLATMLSVNIVIVQRKGGNILVSPFQEIVKNKNKFSLVYILKSGDHFDGLRRLRIPSIFNTPARFNSNTTDSFSNNRDRSNTDTSIGKHQTARQNFSRHNEFLRIDRPAENQGSRFSVIDQAGIEKCATGKPSPNFVLENILTEGNLLPGSPELISSPPQTLISKQRQKWTKGEYISVMESHYEACLNSSETSTTKATYAIWRHHHPNVRLQIDANKLANVRRDIIKQHRLTDIEMNTIKERVRNQINNYTDISENSINSMINVYDKVNITKSENQDFPNSIAFTHESSQKVLVDEDADVIQQSHQLNHDALIVKDKILQHWEILKEQGIDKRKSLPKIKTDRKVKQLIDIANQALTDIKQHRILDITDVNHLIYASALVICEELGLKTWTPTCTNKIGCTPVWKKEIEQKVKNKRSDLSILTEIMKGSFVKDKKRKELERKFNIKTKEDLGTTIETLKQQIQAKAQKLRRIEKRNKFYRQNTLFKQDAKKFYRELGKKQITVNSPPAIEELEQFWSKIWERNDKHNENAYWIKQQEETFTDVEQQVWVDIDVEETSSAIKKSSNWKAPGIDKVPNFWIKALTSLHEEIAKSFCDIMKYPNNCPTWLTNGITFLLPKTGDTSDPKNFRPITCLPTMYKILTSIITDRIYNFLDKNNILPPEQKGCRKASYGCKDQLLINKMILEEVKTKKRNLSTAWIDYKKAFDSVPHSWILKTLEIYKVCPTITSFIAQTMTSWQTTMHLYHSQGNLTSRPLQISSGIFQGDSLSPLLFCLALAPLSAMLNMSTYGYRTGTNQEHITHLFYMDDLKTYAKDDNQQAGLLNIVKTFSDDINMEFGLDKCAKATFKRGKLIKTDNIELGKNTIIEGLDQEGTYKYLGINEGDGIQHSAMKEKIRKEYYRRVRLILQSELNACNKFEAINSLAVPVVTYSFNIINWKISEIANLDRKTRKLLTSNKMHHPKADVCRLYLPRSSGGRGLMQLELSYKLTTIGMECYLSNSKDMLLHPVCQHDSQKKLYSIKNSSSKFKKEINVPQVTKKEKETNVSYAKRTKQTAKQCGQVNLKKEWEDKALHGKYPKRINDADVDQEKTNRWLKSTGLKGETEGLIIAAQDQCLPTKAYRYRILKDQSEDPNCRICGKFEETIDHIISGCPELAKSEYIHRHNRAASYMHWKICKHYKITVTEKWYEHVPQTVTEGENVTILWDMQIQTDRKISANKPDIVIKDKKEKFCTIIDMAVPSERNTSVKLTEKLSKYKDLEIEICRMWGMKTCVIPVIIGALGLVKKGLENYTNKIPGNIQLEELQKIALLGTAHILRRVLSIK